MAPFLDIKYWPGPVVQDPDLILKTLIEVTPWRQEEMRIYGRTVKQPRLTAWYGGAYSYSGINHQPEPMKGLVAVLKTAVEQHIGLVDHFNSVLLNYYRDGNDSIAYHADDEGLFLGPQPIIASLSLGAERMFKFKKRDGSAAVWQRLGNGSLLLMRGDTQKEWLHGIDKEPKITGPRVNLTFRRIV